MCKRLAFLIVAVFLSLGFAPAPLPKPPPCRPDLTAMQGTWVLASRTKDGRPGYFGRRPICVVIERDRMIWMIDGERPFGEIRLVLLPTNRPKAVDMKWEVCPVPTFGVYDLQGDTLLMCFDQERLDRPSALDGKNHSLWVFKRRKR